METARLINIMGDIWAGVQEQPTALSATHPLVSLDGI